MAGKKETAPSKKSENKVKAKIIEDKTFGLKNKNKSSKVGKYVAQVEAQVMSAGSRKAQKEEEARQLARKLKKEEDEKIKMEASLLAKPIIVQPKVPFGVDPKSVLCAFFKAGQCTKGDKCKYSHDLNVDRKSAKIDLFSDMRDESAPSSTMEDWDQKQLENVVHNRHGPGIKTTTEIVCKYFMDAIEQRKYGWFWQCPNGGDSCKYRHALPPGFVLSSKVSHSTDDIPEEDKISLEEFLDQERYKLGDNITPITDESFKRWKAERKARQQVEESERAKKKEAEIKAGRVTASGRDIFTANPELFQVADEEDALDDDILKERAHQTEDDLNYCDSAPVDSNLFCAENSLDDIDPELSEDMEHLGLQ